MCSIVRVFPLYGDSTSSVQSLPLHTVVPTYFLLGRIMLSAHVPSWKQMKRLHYFDMRLATLKF